MAGWQTCPQTARQRQECPTWAPQDGILHIMEQGGKSMIANTPRSAPRRTIHMRFSRWARAPSSTTGSKRETGPEARWPKTSICCSWRHIDRTGSSAARSAGFPARIRWVLQPAGLRRYELLRRFVASGDPSGFRRPRRSAHLPEQAGGGLPVLGPGRHLLKTGDCVIPCSRDPYSSSWCT